MLRKNNKIDYLRSILRYYWGLSSERVTKLKEERPIYYYQGINNGISFVKKVDNMDYLDVIIVAERILDNPLLLKILKTGNLTMLDEDFAIDYFFKLCREQLAEFHKYTLSKGVDKLVDLTFEIDMYNTSSSELLKLLSYIHEIEDLSIPELWEVKKEDRLLIAGALKHIKFFLIMKSRGHKTTNWAQYIFKRGTYQPLEGEFDPREASKEIGLLYFDQFVGN